MVNDATRTWLIKAQQNLKAAQVTLDHNLYDATINRAYYAAFQAAIAALIYRKISQRGGQWGHDYVQATLNQYFIRRQKILSSQLRDTLQDLMLRRHSADYKPMIMTEKGARRALAKTLIFIKAIEEIVRS